MQSAGYIVRVKEEIVRVSMKCPEECAVIGLQAALVLLEHEAPQTLFGRELFYQPQQLQIAKERVR